MRQTRSNTGTSDIQEYSRHGIYLAVEGVPTGPASVNIGLIKIEQYMKVDTDPRENGRPFWQYTPNCTTLEHQMMRLRWATYASKKLQFDNAPKGTIHKKDDDAPDSLRYFMTLQPDMAFDNKGNRVSTNMQTIDAVKDMLVPYRDTGTPGFTPRESVYQVYDSPDSWEFEGVG
jgi:hypothetical protein